MSIGMMMILYCTASQAQLSRLEEIVVLECKDTALGSVIKMMQREYDIPFSYASTLPLGRSISVSVKGQPLAEFLRLVLSAADLSYRIINGSIVLGFSPVTGKPQDQKSPTPERPYKRQAREAFEDSIGRMTPVESINDSHDTTHQHEVSGTINVDQRVALDTARTRDVNQGTVDAVNKGKRTRKAFLSAVNIGYSRDQNVFHFAEPELSFQNYKSDWNRGIQANIIAVLRPKLLASLGVSYTTKSYSFRYHYQIIANDPIPIPDQTDVSISYVEIPVTAGYRVFSFNQLSITVVAGLAASWQTGQRERTSYLNHPEGNSRFFIKSHKPRLTSWLLGLTFRQQVASRLGLFLQPTYIRYFNSVNKEIMKRNTELFRITTGVELKLRD